MLESLFRCFFVLIALSFTLPSPLRLCRQTFDLMESLRIFLLLLLGGVTFVIVDREREIRIRVPSEVIEIGAFEDIE